MQILEARFDDDRTTFQKVSSFDGIICLNPELLIPRSIRYVERRNGFFGTAVCTNEQVKV